MAKNGQAKTAKNPQGAGRSLIKIDWGDLDKLIFLQATLDEIAGYFDCSEDTIETLVKKEKELNFSDYYKKKVGSGKVSLRRLQFKQAEKGNVTMQIWLGKQWLGQKDEARELIDLNLNITHKYGKPRNGKNGKAKK